MKSYMSMKRVLIRAAAAVCSALALPGLAAIVDFDPAGNTEFTLTYPDQFRHQGAAATSARPVTVVANLDGQGNEAVITNRPVVFRVNSDLELTDSWRQNGGTFLKTGPGTLRFNFGGTSPMTMNIGPCCSADGKYSKRGVERFVLPNDGTDPTAGFNGYTIYEGKFSVNAPDTTSGSPLVFPKADRSYFTIGDWIADEGGQEPDVEFVVESGYVNIQTTVLLGEYHGFKDYNTPNGRAKSQITLKPGATLRISGGNSFFMGPDSHPKINNVLKDFHQKNVVRVENGSYFDFFTRQTFNVNKYPGSDGEFDVDGGKVYCPNIYHGSDSNANDGERNLVIDIRNGGQFMNFTLRNCIVTKSRSQLHNVDIRVSGGGVFATDAVTNGVDGTFTFHSDGGTLATYRYIGTEDSNYSNAATDVRNVVEKPILDASIEGLYVSTGGVKIISSGTTYTAPKTPVVAVLAAPIMPDPDMAAGAVDGGVDVVGATAENGIVFAAANTYHGPTVLESGIVTLRGSGDFSDSPVSAADVKLRLLGGARTVSSIALTGQQLDLRLGPDAKLTASDIDVGGAETLFVGFCDADGAAISDAQTDRAVLVFPTAKRDEVAALRVGMSSGSALGLQSWRLVDVADSMTELRVTAVPATQAGAPVFTSDFVGASVIGGQDYAVGSLNAGASAYTVGTYVVAHYTRDGSTSLLERFSYPQHSRTYSSFSEELVASGDYAGTYEVSLVISAISPQAANWTDAAAGDHSMATAGNWESAPASLEDGSANVTLKSGAQMDVIANTRLYGLENSLPSNNAPFVVNAADNELSIDGLFNSKNKGQLVLRGRITTIDDDIADYVPTASGDRQITYYSPLFSGSEPEGLIGAQRADNKWRVPLVLDDVTIEKPVFIQGVYGGYSLFARANTTNVVAAPLVIEQYLTKIYTEPGSRIEARKGWNSTQSFIKQGSGEIRITDVPWSVGGYLQLAEGSLVLDAEGCSVKPPYQATDNYDICTYQSASEVTIECLRSYCFGDGTDSISLENYGNRSPGQGYIRSRTLELHATTQIVQRIRFVSTHADSRLKGDEGALLVVNGGWENNRNYMYTIEGVSGKFKDTVMTNTIQTVGGLGFKLAGEGERLVLAGKNFQSSGLLEAAAGTLELAADATWRNGSDFRASGSGCLAFNADNQVDKGTAVFRFSEDGSVDIAAGVLLKINEAFVKVGDEWRSVPSGMYDDRTSSRLMAGRVTGGGMLKVGTRAGSIIYVR